jgi:hypothetical protein
MLHANFQIFFDNLIENYEFFLYKTSQKILIKSWPRLKPTPAFAIPPPMAVRIEGSNSDFRLEKASLAAWEKFCPRNLCKLPITSNSDGISKQMS